MMRFTPAAQHLDCVRHARQQILRLPGQTPHPPAIRSEQGQQPPADVARRTGKQNEFESGHGKSLNTSSGNETIQIFQHQFGTDARRFEDHRQAAAWMRAAAHEIHAVEFLEAILRAEVQHLREGVR